MEPSIEQLTRKDKTSTLSKLEDWHPEELNEFALSVTKYFKNQTPYNSNEPYTDPLFPPCENSLLGIKDHKGNLLENIIKSEGKKKSIKNEIPDVGSIVWLRASEIFEGKKYAVFESSISASDVNQGSVGDCYFLSSLAGMCKSPQLLMQIFRTPFVTENSCYEIILRLNGIWKVVLLDDYFPCNINTKKPIFAKPNGNEIWVMLLEKAWAKINGGYNYISGGFNSEVWECFTGFPCFEYRMDTKCFEFVHNFLKFPLPPQGQSPSGNKGIAASDLNKKLWSKILSCLEEKAYMYTYSKKEENGIVAIHAYTLLDAKERKVNGELVKLVKLRNPWGYGEWQGDWSDKSPKWTKEAKEAFGLKEFSDDGCFYIPYASYLEYFDTFGVCNNLDPICSRTNTMRKANEDHKSHVFDLFLSRKSQVNVSVFRKSFRFNKAIDMEASIHLGVVIAKKGSSETNRIEYVNVYNNNLHLRTNLEAGSYLIFVECNYGRTYMHGDRFYPFDKFRKITIDVAADNFFDLTYIGIDSTKAGMTLHSKDKITPLFFKKKYLFTPVKAKETINSGYTFLGRAVKFKSNPYIVKLDPYLQAVRYYSKKFPKEMTHLNKLEKMKNRDNSIRPKDTTFVYRKISENIFYLGESINVWYFNMNGPGILVYAEEGLCYGYFKDNKKNGLFTYFDRGVMRTIYFENDKPQGEAHLYFTSEGERENKILMEYILEDGKLKGFIKSEIDIKIPNSEDQFDYLWNDVSVLDFRFNKEIEEVADIEKIDLNDGEDIEDVEESILI